ncbi:nucleic acid-binding protein [Streptomyces sp. NPDC090106]|uniref:nucleic acid-binding protein n=1 Tax=Streptomyces sp. NPDC090106 TaxID=3365946 RepID=UPI00382C26AA
MTTFDYPASLLELQQQLTAAQVELRAVLADLPYSVEPMEAWTREGYWLAQPRTYAASPGWTQEERDQVAALRERERELAAAIIQHPFWAEVAAPDRTDARSGLKHAASDRNGGDQAAA